MIGNRPHRPALALALLALASSPGVGAGGPSHSFETLNGDVLIRLADAGAAAEESP